MEKWLSDFGAIKRFDMLTDGRAYVTFEDENGAQELLGTLSLSFRRKSKERRENIRYMASCNRKTKVNVRKDFEKCVNL